MGKKCQGGCNRIFDEYYILKDGSVFCYDCWVRAKEKMDQIKSERAKFAEEEKKRHDENNKAIEYLEREIVNQKLSNSIEWSSYDYDDDAIPSNYAVVQSLSTRIGMLRSENSTWRKFPFYGDQSYLDNPTFYSSERLEKQKEKQWKQQQEVDDKRINQQQEEDEKCIKQLQEQRIITEAMTMFKTVQKQVFSPETKMEANAKIAEIKKLLQSKSYANMIKALELMEKEYEWKYNNG